MSCDRALRRTVAVLLVGACFHFGGAPVAAADDMIPERLPQAKKDVLRKFLSTLEKPKRFLPPRAKLVGPALPGLDLPVDAPLKGLDAKEYLAEVRPHDAADRLKGPDKVDLYWFRPNPQKGAPGLTVKRVVDLNTGKQIGDTEVRLDYAAPLTREEKAQAIGLAKKEVTQVRTLYTGAGKGDIEVVGLFEHITAAGVPDGMPGDRVVNLQFRRKRSPDVISVNVNVTKGTVREVK
jgi:hypothetical protein